MSSPMTSSSAKGKSRALVKTNKAIRLKIGDVICLNSEKVFCNVAHSCHITRDELPFPIPKHAYEFAVVVDATLAAEDSKDEEVCKGRKAKKVYKDRKDEEVYTVDYKVRLLGPGMEYRDSNPTIIISVSGTEAEHRAVVKSVVLHMVEQPRFKATVGPMDLLALALPQSLRNALERYEEQLRKVALVEDQGTASELKELRTRCEKLRTTLLEEIKALTA